MKDVTIISKVVGRKEGDRPVTGGGSQAAVDLSAYLLKKTWDTAWELREKDGVLYLFGKLPVVLQSGMTSYVADEAVDLPGIYDGLPIDNQTLKWVETTDENGAVSRVLVAAGGGTGGGGSVQFPLTWSGFSNGSWDGSEAKTIQIPSKLSDLENDGFFKDYGWTGSDANEQYFGSYLYGGVANSNTPIDSGQLIAYNAKDGGCRGYQMFMHGQNYFFRQHWDNEWKPWRKIISGNVDGVIDYNLKVGGDIEFKEEGWGDAFRIKPYFIGSDDDNYLAVERSVGGAWEEPFYNDCLKIRGQTGKIEHICYHETAIEITHSHAPMYNWCNGIKLLNPILDSGQYEQIQLGKETSWYNCGYIAYKHQWSEVDGTRSSFVTIGLNGVDEVLNVTGYRRVGINTAAPRHELEVNGQIGVTNNMLLYGNGNGDIKSVYNNDGAITNIVGHETAAIRHALKFYCEDESYEIGVVSGGGADARGFGVTHGNNKLVWKVNRERMDVYGDLRIKNGLIKYHENDELFYFGGKLDSLTIASLQQQLNGLWKRNWFEDLYATMIMADNASFERLYGDSIIIGDCKLSYDYEKGTLVIQKFDGTDTNVVISGGLTAYSTEV